ncbi:unnamed protein product, partial [Tenebrio molitor]
TSKIKQHHRSTGSAATPQSHAKKKKAKNPRAKPSHPPTSRWSTTPSRTQGTRRIVSSRPSKVRRHQITKSTPKRSPLSSKYLKGAVALGISVVQTKGKGASGSFKLASSTSGGAKVASASEQARFVRRIQDEKIIRQTYRRRDTSDKASRRQPKNKPPPKRKTAAERRRAAAASAAAAKAKNRPPPRLKRKLEPPRNPDRLQSEEILTRLVRLKNPKHPNPRQPKP